MSGSPRYLRVILRVPPEREEDAVAVCWDSGSLGATAEPIAGGRRVALTAYFPFTPAGGTVARRLSAALQCAGIAVDPASLRPALMASADWVEAWQRSLRPTRVGRRFLIIPEGCAAPPSRGRIPLHVRLGQAFGTGEHATTRMALRLMERVAMPRTRVIDLGTGSGILAMAARRLGAAAVVAVDHDPAALRVARANLEDNGLAGRVVLRKADASRALRGGRFDVAVVNIGTTSIERMLPGISAALRPGGRAILTGLLVEDEERILSAAGRTGLRPRGRLRSGPWSALVVGRAAPS